MSKVIKQMEMDDMRRTFQDVRDMVVMTTDKLNCLGEYTLRANLRKKKIRLKIVKNSLCRKVFKDLDIQVPDDSPYWQKQTVLAWGASSVSELSREIAAELKNPKTAALYKEKDKEKVQVKGAIADGQPVTFEQALKMPTRLELISEILSMILGPGATLAGCLTGVASEVASQIKQLGEKKEDAVETPAETTAS